MLPDRVSNPGPLTYESGALPIALRGPAFLIFGISVAYLSPTSRCLTVGTVIVISGCDRSGIVVLLVFFIMVFLGQSSA